MCLPDAIEDEEELDEDAAEGKDASHDDTGQWTCVERLLGDLTRDLVGAHGVLNGLQTGGKHQLLHHL